MVGIARFHEISESSHRVMNPISLEKVLLVGEICGVGEGTRILDLASGKGEMLCQYARSGAGGLGIDNHLPFLDAARARAAALGVEGRVRFVEGDASRPGEHATTGEFDVVTCIGASWIGGGLTGTLGIMRPFLDPDSGGFLVVGEVYWIEPPSERLLATTFGADEEGFADLGGTLERIEAAGLDLVEMVIASQDDWDRYAASQWRNVSDWLAANPDDPEAAEVRQIRDESRRTYLSEERRVLGWGIFVMREQP